MFLSCCVRPDKPAISRGWWATETVVQWQGETTISLELASAWISSMTRWCLPPVQRHAPSPLPFPLLVHWQLNHRPVSALVCSAELCSYSVCWGAPPCPSCQIRPEIRLNAWSPALMSNRPEKKRPPCINQSCHNCTMVSTERVALPKDARHWNTSWKTRVENGWLWIRLNQIQRLFNQ